MWRYIIGLSSEVNLLIHVNAGNDKEDTRTSCLTSQHPSKSEDNSSFILLDNLDNIAEREGEGDTDKEQGYDSKDMGNNSWSFITSF